MPSLTPLVSTDSLTAFRQGNEAAEIKEIVPTKAKTADKARRREAASGTAEEKARIA